MASVSDKHKEKEKQDEHDDANTNTTAPPLSRRGRRTIPRLLPILDHTEPPIYIPGYARAPKADDINLSTAENWLLRPQLVPKFLEYINQNFGEADLSYVSGFGGAPGLLSGLASFFNNYFDPKVQVLPDHIVTAPGASHLLQSVMYHICNEREAVLIQTPYWPGFDSALDLRDELTAVHVDIPFSGEGADPFGPDIVHEYERAFEISTEKITAIIICNPQNPVGGYYPEETMKGLLLFAKRHKLHVVVDELYALSVFKPQPEGRFKSVLSMDLVGLGVDPGMVHVVYSFSKDLNSSGIRLGVFVTQDNVNLRNAVGAQQQSKLSSLTSIAASGLLHDEEFLDGLLQDNPELLLNNYEIIEGFFQHHKIPFIPATAGVYALGNLLSVTDPERPMTFEEEKKLDQEFTSRGVRVNRGDNFHAKDPGWFRVIFALPKEKLVTGLKRVEAVLGLKGWEPPAL